MSAQSEGLPTGVIGLDHLLRGGILLPVSGNGLVVLIRGQPGTGKTTLAIQLAAGACKWDMHNARSIEVHSCEQDRDDLLGLCERLEIDSVAAGGPEVGDGAHIKIEGWKKQEAADLEVPIDTKRSPLSWALSLAAELNADDSGDRRRLVVVDGLNVLQPEQRHEFEIEELVLSLRRNCLVGIIVYEPGDLTSGGMHSLADMVIELRGEEAEGPPKYYLNHLCIAKSRFQQSVLGWHQYKIRKTTGINVFPALHFRVHRADLLGERFDQSMTPLSKLKVPGEERQSHTEDGAVLTYLIGAENLKRGSCTAVLGPRRTWKTQLTSDFLRAGSRQGEAGLLVSFLDNQGTIVGERSHLCKRYCLRKLKRPKGSEEDAGCRRPADQCWEGQEYSDCYQKFFLFHFRPGCLATGEFFHFLEERLRRAEDSGDPIKRLVFWDLTQLESRFPLLASDTMFLPGLMDYLKHSEDKRGKGRRITSVFMGAPNTRLAWAAQAMADNVIFCWQGRHKTEGLGIALYVDRIEGVPGGKILRFLKESRQQDTNVGKMIQECDEADLPEADQTIRAVRDLQGLPGPRTGLRPETGSR